MCVEKHRIIFAIASVGFLIFLFGVLFGFIFFDMIINDQIYKNVRLKEGTDQFDRWKDLPLDVFYRVYMFNVTNVEEIMTDSSVKPIVSEMGPYVYRQSRKKENITYDEDGDLLEYWQYQHFTFDADESYPNTEDDEVTIVNILLNAYFNLGSVLLTESLHPVLDDYWQYLFSDTKTLFHTVKVGDLLFHGVRFCEPDVVAENIVASFLCEVLKNITISGIKVDEDGSILFALLFMKHDQHDGRYTINAGIKNVNELGMIKYWEGLSYLDIWNDGESKCNKVYGSDGTIFPPHLKADADLGIFATELCRTAYIYHVGEDEILGIKGQRKELKEDTFALSNPENSCFCKDSTRDLYGEKRCLPDGFFDLQPCMGPPLVASFPHFFLGDEEYSNTVIGTSANKSIHGTFAIIEPDLGVPLAGYRRIQFNAILRPITGVGVTQVRNTMLPILWAEEGVAITEEYADMLKDMYVKIVDLLDILKWVIIGVGLLMFVGFGGLYIYKLFFTLS